MQERISGLPVWHATQVLSSNFAGRFFGQKGFSNNGSQSIFWVEKGRRSSFHRISAKISFFWGSDASIHHALLDILFDVAIIVLFLCKLSSLIIEMYL